MVKSAHKLLSIMLVSISMLSFPTNALSLHLIRGVIDQSFTVLEGEFSVTKGQLKHLFVRETGHAILKIGAKIDRLVATGQSEIDVTQAAEIIYVEADDKSIIRISDGVIGYLIMQGHSRAHIDKMISKSSFYPLPDIILKDGGIILGVDAVIHIWADNVSFEEGRLNGKWSDGTAFSILFILCKSENGVDKYEIAKSQPHQIYIHKTDLINTREQ